MRKLTPKNIITELLKIDAVKRFYRQSDHQTINRMIVKSYHLLAEVERDDIEYILAAWVTLGNLERINDETISQSTRSKEDDYKDYLRFRNANQMMVNEFVKILKKIRLAYYEVEDQRVRDIYFAKFCVACIALLLAGRSFFIASNQ